jgi:hypothetical protein
MRFGGGFIGFEVWRASDLQVADLGHLALPMKIHSVWLERLQEEFFAQV